jgi:hypothetical protein
MMSLILNNGVVMPALGFGVFQTPPEETIESVETALRTGYRLIDTAAAYANEREVGEGIRRAGVRRADVFIGTKIWISDYGYDTTLHSFDKSAGKLGVDQIDLLILHQALPSRFDLTVDAYRALEKLLDDGRVRAIGVSNFMPEHLEELLRNAAVVPAVNQIEVHHHRRHRQGARQDPRAGDAALAPAAGALRDPEVDPPAADRRELRRLRLRARRVRARRDRLPRPRRAARTRAISDHPRDVRAGDPGSLTDPAQLPARAIRSMAVTARSSSAWVL